MPRNQHIMAKDINCQMRLLLPLQVFAVLCALIAVASANSVQEISFQVDLNSVDNPINGRLMMIAVSEKPIISNKSIEYL